VATVVKHIVSNLKVSYEIIIINFDIFEQSKNPKKKYNLSLFLNRKKMWKTNVIWKHNYDDGDEHTVSGLINWILLKFHILHTSRFT
jgi:hypothetical protein